MNLPKETAELLEAYFADTPSQEAVESMETWLREDKSHSRLFAEYGLIDRLISHEQKNQDASAIFASLLEAEEEAEPIIVEKPTPQTIKLDRDPSDAISFKQACAALSYLAKQSLRNKTAPIAAIAAVLVLAVALVFIFRGGPVDTPQANPIANDDTARPTVVEPLTVATLTATHNAKWGNTPAERALARGSEPHPSTRLTLTAGFAEITTQRGAVAILEAPATIELLDSPNALRLHAGKLVGICETESSKGFLVRTANAEIIDLGTKFAVEIMPDGSTQTLVFSGEVELREVSDSPNQVTSSVRLAEGWSSRIDKRGQLQAAAESMTPELASRFTISLDDLGGPKLAYRRLVLESDPILYWGFDERQDTTANLAGQNAWDGKAIGQTDHDQGLFGAGLKLTGEIESMGGFMSATPLNLDKIGAYTLEAWYRADRAQLGRVLSLDHIDPAALEPPKTLSVIELSQDPQDKQRASSKGKQIRYVHRNPPSRSAGDGKDSFSDRPSPMNEWVHVVAVKDGNSVRLYINGELVEESNDPQPVATDLPMTLCVGVSAYAITPAAIRGTEDYRPFAGTIDELAVYDSALTEQTIQAHDRSGRSDQNEALLP